MNRSDPTLSVVVPVFNEQVLIREFYHRAQAVLDQTGLAYELIFVDDGSTDDSFVILNALHNQAPRRVKVVQLTRNFGHQIAITAGQRNARGQAVVVLDCDLQDPPELIAQFLEKWNEGFDIVYGVRAQRRGETIFKRFTAKIFYKILRMFAFVDIPENAGDFYLLDRKVVDELNRMDECHRFLRGMVAWTGFKRFGVVYDRDARCAGQTKFSFWTMLKFSVDAITSFSFMPLRFISLFGAVISLLAFLGIIIVMVIKISNHAALIGWASLMVTILFIGGIQIFAMGVIGEYLARIGDDVKKRPLYTVQQIVECSGHES